MKKTALFIIILAVVITGTAFSDDEKPSLLSSLTFKIDPAIFGLFIDTGYKGFSFAPGLDTILWLTAGAAYETVEYYRLPDGTMYRGSAADRDFATDPLYSRLGYKWGLGITQGIVKGTIHDKDLLTVFLRYRGRHDTHFENTDYNQLVFDADIEDRGGLLQHTILAGLVLDGISEDTVHKISDGIYGEISAEWGPEWFFNDFSGRSDFIRFNATAKAFKSLYAVPSEGKSNIFGLYAGTFFAVDYAIGDYIPMNIRQSFGGLSPRTGLGKAVRGVNEGAFDTTLKAVNNTELRVTLPSLFFPGLVPGVVVYFDTGYYNDLGNSVTVESGLLFSTGIGAYINVFDIASIAFYTHYFINGINASGESFIPFEIAFGLHF